jgi:mannose-6-phosphate isomerase-like protein (cupin superfamily)
MNVKNIRKMKYFTSVDGCKIAETFGIPTEGIKDASIAYAILASGDNTKPHCHNFLEWYIIVKGKAEMTIGKEKRLVGKGDNIMIPKNKRHSIFTKGATGLEFYCFCVPAFTTEATRMKNAGK